METLPYPITAIIISKEKNGVKILKTIKHITVLQVFVKMLVPSPLSIFVNILILKQMKKLYLILKVC